MTMCGVRMVVLVCMCFATVGKECSAIQEVKMMELGSMPTPEVFKEVFMDAMIPVVMREVLLQNRVWHTWQEVAEDLGDVPVRVGRGPYPQKSARLRDYFDVWQTFHPLDHEMPVVFQYGNVPLVFSLENRCEVAKIPEEQRFVIPYSMPIHDEKEYACRLLERFHVPNFLRDKVQILHAGLLIGPVGDSIGFHKHTDAINMLFVGKKQWTIRNDTHRFTTTQYPGDLVYIPENMDHVMNLEPSVAMQMQWDPLHWDDRGFQVMLQYMLQGSLMDDEDTVS